jgi:hypothetical protein
MIFLTSYALASLTLTRKPDPVFTLFPKLALELREMIWKEALPQ